MTAIAIRRHPSNRRLLPRAVGLLVTLALSACAGAGVLMFFGPPLTLVTIVAVIMSSWRLWRPDHASPRLTAYMLPSRSRTAVTPEAPRPRPAQT